MHKGMHIGVVDWTLRDPQIDERASETEGTLDWLYGVSFETENSDSTPLLDSLLGVQQMFRPVLYAAPSALSGELAVGTEWSKFAIVNG